jgi:CsoR family transcriptional regulator, copper-sensing transcriptional repressor
MEASKKAAVLKRLAFVDGHLQGVRRMVEADKYCVDVLKQTFAIRRAIEKIEALMLDNHLHTCVIEGIKDGRDDQVVGELLDLYELAGR